MDGHFVPPIALGTAVVACAAPMDLPDAARPPHGRRARRRTSRIWPRPVWTSFPSTSEAVPDPGPAIAKARAAGLRRRADAEHRDAARGGVPLSRHVDDVMLMSIRPGWSGQQLNPEVYPRLEAVRAEIDRRGLAVDVEIDGGVKVENARRAVDAGRHRPDRRVGYLRSSRIRRRPPASSPRSRPAAHGRRGAEMCPRPSWSSTTIRTSRGSSR